MLCVSFVGAVLASFYGFGHDQWTFSIGPEYFTKMKFKQFHFAVTFGSRFGASQEMIAGLIGVLATWWVGFVLAWFLARRHIPGQSRSSAVRKILYSFVIVLVCGVVAGMSGYAYGIFRGPDADYSAWSFLFRRYFITDFYAFVRVAYIHNASYAGGGIGFVLALLVVRPYKDSPKDKS